MVCTNTLVHMIWHAEQCTATQKAKQNNLWCTCWNRVRTWKKAPMVNTETSDVCSSSDILPCYSHVPHGDQQIANSSGLLCHQGGCASRYLLISYKFSSAAQGRRGLIMVCLSSKSMFSLTPDFMQQLLVILTFIRISAQIPDLCFLLPEDN